MEALRIEATDKTPEVVFDPAKGLLHIKGCSIHENAARFYEDLFAKVEAYAAMPARRTEVRIALEYFNSSSAKYLLDILKRIDDLHATGASKASLEWRCEDGDLDMQEAGNDYKALLEMPVKVLMDPGDQGS